MSRPKKEPLPKSTGSFCITCANKGIVELSGTLPNGTPFEMYGSIEAYPHRSPTSARYFTGKLAIETIHLMPSMQQLEAFHK